MLHWGIIPALAGNTKTPTFFKSACRDHPRACGEHVEELDRFMSQQGSSPRLRGTHDRNTSLGTLAGIIPALAGNTLAICAGKCDDMDHPRACGNTTDSVPRHHAVWDHPRACGEHPVLPAVHGDGGGSSPRLRGTRDRRERHVANQGIIPALAGNTIGPCVRARRGRDHPRACGEHPAWFPFLCLLLGSSPRLRGTLEFFAHGVFSFGIIPALAGNTLSLSCFGLIRWDHPRACGEHAARLIMLSIVLGSSPRLRGTPRRTACGATASGIIPALAGNTRWHSA